MEWFIFTGVVVVIFAYLLWRIVKIEMAIDLIVKEILK